MSEIRVLPLPKVTGIWEHDTSQYPDKVRIPMSDGKVVTYRIDVNLPHPAFVDAMENVRKMRVGYQYGYEGKHVKK